MPGYQNHIQIREKNFACNMNNRDNVNYLVNSDLFIFILISYHALVNILYKLTLYISYR